MYSFTQFRNMMCLLNFSIYKLNFAKKSGTNEHWCKNTVFTVLNLFHFLFHFFLKNGTDPKSGTRNLTKS